ncbi:MAG: hypothetical protein HOV77_11700 [Hamadaea sp.]|uniref:hypothetical protein n=1 Tax=Hamadaea sp. TaxID=2024425 RepID=UPI0017F6F97F|nr:hypothetical protein [Hamadaea sp.]NUT19844.1 hypothetical protein [Hamadaea sp.]
MDTIATLAHDLDVTTEDVQAYVQELIRRDGEQAVIAAKRDLATETALTDAAAHQVRVQLTH